MSMEKKNLFTNYLEERTAAVNDEINRLIADNRRDEADFEKIRANIYQMIKTVFLAFGRTCKEENEQVRLFDSRLSLFETVWKEALAKAEEHSDEKRILQEHVKLEVLEEVRGTFERLWR